MKKFMSVFLAVIMMFSIALPVFAAEGEVKDVDNTFDNFEPAPGKKAPDNWYDPYCYEADGRINKYCLNVGYDNEIAYYCPEYKKIFTVADLGRTLNPNVVGGFTIYDPYTIFCTNFPIEPASGTTEIRYIDLSQWYCPYCGKYSIAPYENDAQYKAEAAYSSHLGIKDVIYGFNCTQCGNFSGTNHLANNHYRFEALSFPEEYQNAFAGCSHTNLLANVKLYRFISEEQRNAEYSFIFTETEKDFGDGKDGRMEDLEFTNNGVACNWNSPDNPNYKPPKKTFKDKLITFFNKIAAFFVKIGTWIKNLFK